MFDKIEKRKGTCGLFHVWCFNICILHPAMPIHLPQWNNPGQVSGRHRGAVSSWWFSVSSLIAGDVLFWYNLQLTLHLKISLENIKDSVILDFEWFANTSDYSFNSSGEEWYQDFGWNSELFPEPTKQLKKYLEDLGCWCVPPRLLLPLQFYAIANVGRFIGFVHSTYICAWCACRAA